MRAKATGGIAWERLRAFAAIDAQACARSGRAPRETL
jgi:hypothetical protein